MEDLINGLADWNIPKHLAKFVWTKNVNGSTSVKVFPHDTSTDARETHASEVPIFQAAFTPTRFVPHFPVSTTLFKYLGVDVSLVQPPLPEGDGSQRELPGTEEWCKIVPFQSSRNACLGWFDLKQVDDEGEQVGEHENFWPGLRRWSVGVKMEDADIEFPEGTHWDSPRSIL